MSSSCNGLCSARTPPPEFEDVLPDLIEITLHDKVCVPHEGRDRPACGRRFVRFTSVSAGVWHPSAGSSRRWLPRCEDDGCADATTSASDNDAAIVFTSWKPTAR